MANFSLSTSLLVATALIASTYGFSLPGGSNELFRKARSSSRTQACDAVASCYFDNPAYGMLTLLTNYYYEQFTGHLDQFCPNLNVRACKSDDCNGRNMDVAIDFTNDVLQRACADQQEFHDNAACWTNGFQSTMMGCEMQRSSTPTSHCLSEAVHNLPGCTAEARAFFIRMSGYVLAEQSRTGM